MAAPTSHLLDICFTESLARFARPTTPWALLSAKSGCVHHRVRFSRNRHSEPAPTSRREQRSGDARQWRRFVSGKAGDGPSLDLAFRLSRTVLKAYGCKATGMFTLEALCTGRCCSDPKSPASRISTRPSAQTPIPVTAGQSQSLPEPTSRGQATSSS